MDAELNDGCSGVPMTPSRNSNRHELLWENFPNCTDAHWEEIGRTPNVGPRPRNYSKAVNLSGRRRTVSEGQDWLDDFGDADFDKVFVDDKFAPFRDASSQVSGGRFKDAGNSLDDVSEEEVAPERESCNRERKRSVGPRVLESGDFSSSSDDVLHGPVFYMGSGKTSLISNSPDMPSPRNSRHQLTKDISRAAKQLKYFEQPRKERGQRTGSLSATTKSSPTREYLNGYTAVDWPIYQGLETQINASGVDGSKLGKGIFRISNTALVAKVDQPTRLTRNPLELPTNSDEDSPYPNEVFASSRDSYEESTSKNSCCQESSKLKDMFAWNICFDPTPMKSDGALFATRERKESLQNTSRQGGASRTVTQPQSGTSRKKWDKTSKNANLECRKEPLASIAFNDGQPNLLDLDEDNLGHEAENVCRKKDSQRYLRSVPDRSYRKQIEQERITDPFSRTQKLCELMEMQKSKYSSCERRARENPVIFSNPSNSLRRDNTRLRCGNHYGKGSDRQSVKHDRFDSKKRSKCTVYGKEKCRDHHHHRSYCEMCNETSDSLEGSWNEEACRHGGCDCQCCPLAACLPMLLSHGCNHRVLTNFACKSKTCTCCTVAKPRVCSRRRKPCSVHVKPQSTLEHSSQELEPDFEAGYDEIDREFDSLVGVDSTDGKTYFVSEKSRARKVQRGNSQSLMKSTELPVLVSYRRSVDTATDVLEAEQKSDVSSQTEPTTLNCSTQVKPVVRHSVTQYSTKVNHHNKDTQCLTRTTSVCTQAVVFEPLDHGTQFPERKENHHKQTQCNFATGRKSVQANLKYKPNLFGFSYGTGAGYRNKDDYSPDDCSFRSSHSSYLLPSDVSTDLRVVAPKSAPSSAVVAVAAASASADLRPQESTRKDSNEQPPGLFEVSPVTLRCSVMSVRPVAMFPNDEIVVVNERSGEDCVDEGRQRTLSLRNSSGENSSVYHGSRSRGKSVSFPTDIARFFDHPYSPRRLLSSDDSGNSDEIKNNVHSLPYGGYMN